MTTQTQSLSLDMGAHYTVAGYGGIAWYVVGYATEWTEGKWVFLGDDDDDPDDETFYAWNEPEEYDDPSRVRCVMVGDDRTFTFDVDELAPIAELDYCAECGQIGCTADGRSRDDEDY